jgi:hypothetical protein
MELSEALKKLKKKDDTPPNSNIEMLERVLFSNGMC